VTTFAACFAERGTTQKTGFYPVRQLTTFAACFAERGQHKKPVFKPPFMRIEHLCGLALLKGEEHKEPVFNNIYGN
jgi:hypothetical protein